MKKFTKIAMAALLVGAAGAGITAYAVGESDSYATWQVNASGVELATSGTDMPGAIYFAWTESDVESFSWSDALNVELYPGAPSDGSVLYIPVTATLGNLKTTIKGEVSTNNKAVRIYPTNLSSVEGFTEGGNLLPGKYEFIVNYGDVIYKDEEGVSINLPSASFTFNLIGTTDDEPMMVVEPTPFNNGTEGVVGDWAQVTNNDLMLYSDLGNVVTLTPKNVESFGLYNATASGLKNVKINLYPNYVYAEGNNPNPAESFEVSIISTETGYSIALPAAMTNYLSQNKNVLVSIIIAPYTFMIDGEVYSEEYQINYYTINVFDRNINVTSWTTPVGYSYENDDTFDYEYGTPGDFNYAYFYFAGYAPLTINSAYEPTAAPAVHINFIPLVNPNQVTVDLSIEDLKLGFINGLEVGYNGSMEEGTLNNWNTLRVNIGTTVKNLISAFPDGGKFTVSVDQNVVLGPKGYNLTYDASKTFYVYPTWPNGPIVDNTSNNVIAITWNGITIGGTNGQPYLANPSTLPVGLEPILYFIDETDVNATATKVEWANPLYGNITYEIKANSLVVNFNNAGSQFYGYYYVEIPEATFWFETPATTSVPSKRYLNLGSETPIYKYDGTLTIAALSGATGEINPEYGFVSDYTYASAYINWSYLPLAKYNGNGTPGNVILNCVPFDSEAEPFTKEIGWNSLTLVPGGDEDGEPSTGQESAGSDVLNVLKVDLEGLVTVAGTYTITLDANIVQLATGNGVNNVAQTDMPVVTFYACDAYDVDPVIEYNGNNQFGINWRTRPTIKSTGNYVPYVVNVETGSIHEMTTTSINNGVVLVKLPTADMTVGSIYQVVVPETTYVLNEEYLNNKAQSIYFQWTANGPVIANYADQQFNAWTLKDFNVGTTGDFTSANFTWNLPIAINYDDIFADPVNGTHKTVYLSYTPWDSSLSYTIYLAPDDLFPTSYDPNAQEGGEPIEIENVLTALIDEIVEKTGYGTYTVAVDSGVVSSFGIPNAATAPNEIEFKVYPPYADYVVSNTGNNVIAITWNGYQVQETGNQYGPNDPVNLKIIGPNDISFAPKYEINEYNTVIIDLNGTNLLDGEYTLIVPQSMFLLTKGKNLPMVNAEKDPALEFLVEGGVIVDKPEIGFLPEPEAWMVGDVTEVLPGYYSAQFTWNMPVELGNGIVTVLNTTTGEYVENVETGVADVMFGGDEELGIPGEEKCVLFAYFSAMEAGEYTISLAEGAVEADNMVSAAYENILSFVVMEPWTGGCEFTQNDETSFLLTFDGAVNVTMGDQSIILIDQFGDRVDGGIWYMVPADRPFTNSYVIGINQYLEGGEYTFIVPEGSFVIDGEYLNKDIYYTFEYNPGTDGINGISAEADGMYRVYNLNGVMMLQTRDASELKNLNNGLYIINGKKVNIRK